MIIISYIQSHQVYRFFGPVFNPFFVSDQPIINAFGYMFLIVLWWVGQYTFWYSIGMNQYSPFLYAWTILISTIYLVVGLISMLAIPSCWRKFGMSAYTLKWYSGFVGIGAGLPPLLTGRGMPKFS
jgi:hypothetical protein